MKTACAVNTAAGHALFKFYPLTPSSISVEQFLPYMNTLTRAGGRFSGFFPSGNAAVYGVSATHGWSRAVKT
jgi:hypothetical protein